MQQTNYAGISKNVAELPVGDLHDFAVALAGKSNVDTDHVIAALVRIARFGSNPHGLNEHLKEALENGEQWANCWMKIYFMENAADFILDWVGAFQADQDPATAISVKNSIPMSFAKAISDAFENTKGQEPHYEAAWRWITSDNYPANVIG